MIELHALLNADPDLSVYEIKEGDHETPATLSVAGLKELLLAVNVCSRRIHALRRDLEAVENEIAELKRDPNDLRVSRTDVTFVNS